MPEIVVPKYPPSWEAWGDTCCCEPLMASRLICCSNATWFVSQYGTIGRLAVGNQYIQDVGSITKYYNTHCCRDYLGFPSDIVRGTMVTFYKGQQIYTGPYRGGYNCSRSSNGFHAIKINDTTIIAWYLGNIIFNGEAYDFDGAGNHSGVEYFAVMPSANTMILWFRDKKIFDGEYAYSQIYGECYALVRHNNTITVWYRANKILDAEPDRGWASGGGSECFIAVLVSGTENTSLFLYYYEGQLVFERNIGVQTEVINYECYKNYAYITYDTHDTSTNPITLVFYRATKLYEGDAISGFYGPGEYMRFNMASESATLHYNGNEIYSGNYFGEVRTEGVSGGDRSGPIGDYYALLPTRTTAILYYKGEEIYNGDYYAARFRTGSDYAMVQPTNMTAILYYKGEKLHEWSTSAPGVPFFDSEYALSILNRNMAIAWYRGEEIYNGAYFQAGAACGDFFVLFPSATSTIVFCKGKWCDEDYSQRVSWSCCSGRLYVTQTLNGETYVDIWDSDFGKMKFDVNTFNRLA